VFVATLFVCLWTWVVILVRPLDSLFPPRELPAWIGILAFVVIAAGGMLAAWCVTAFTLQGRGTPAPFDPPRRLVAVGPYRWIRNPMYIGGGLVLLGFGLLLKSPSIVLLVPMWLLLFHLFVVLYEERALRGKFGREYDDYCRRTPRWIPRFTSAARCE
jgi:protein-S-isoprenylcysteine O-methyltransferase Ste14